MEEKASSADRSMESSQLAEEKTAVVESAGPSAERAGSEHRQAYGTAKTENLRDSGLWRVLLPAAVIVFCLALFIIPLLILIPLFSTSLAGIRDGNAGEGQLLWVWITMIVIEIAIWVLIVRGLLKIFLTQAVNYQS